MVPPVRFELTTSPLPREYSTPELRRRFEILAAQCHDRDIHAIKQHKYR